MRRTNINRTSRLNPKRGPRRRPAPQEDTDWWVWANQQLATRSRGLCECCGVRLVAVERHHRQRRQVGGNRLAVLLLLHPQCHQWVTEHPRESREHGWIVSAYEQDVEQVPVLLWGKKWMILNDAGEAIPVEKPAASDQ